MITGGALEIGAVLVELGGDLELQFNGGRANPAVAYGAAGQISACEKQAGQIGQIMIAAKSLVPLQIARDVSAMFLDAAAQCRDKGIVKFCAGSDKQVVSH